MNRCCHCPDFAAECPLAQELAEGVVLANPSSEHCAVIRYGPRVVKHLKPILHHRRAEQAASYARRDEVAAAHPDLFVPAVFDATTRTVEQPFIEGRVPTEREFAGVVRELDRRGLGNVYDVHLTNVVIVDGRALIVDFQVQPARGKERA